MTPIDPVEHSRVWGAEQWYDARSPVLIKRITTRERLSVQVHPSGEAGVGKTEMWFVTDAAAEAVIGAGFVAPVARERMREAAVSGEIERLIAWHPARAGQSYFIPAGTVHAIGGGITLWEVQQNSDITYRLYDYGRPRELHLDAAIAVADGGVHPGAAVERAIGGGWLRLVECAYFVVDRITATGRLEIEPSAGQMLIDLGAGTVARADDGAVLIPQGALRLLRVRVP